MALILSKNDEKALVMIEIFSLEALFDTEKLPSLD